MGKDKIEVDKQSMIEILETPYYKEHPHSNLAKKLRKKLKELEKVTFKKDDTQGGA